jgi:hypothetical protein
MLEYQISTTLYMESCRSPAGSRPLTRVQETRPITTSDDVMV